MIIRRATVEECAALHDEQLGLRDRAFARRHGGWGARRWPRGSGGSPGVVPLFKYTDGTHTRGSEAFQFGSSLSAGTWVGNNVLRKSGIRSPNGLPYYQIEGARTNLVPYSTDRSQWTAIGTPTRTAGQASPDGLSTADLLGDDNNAGHELYETASFAVAASTAYTASVWVKKDAVTTRFVGIALTDVTANTIFASLNTSTGSAAFAGAIGGGFTAIAQGAFDMGDWWLFWLRGTTAAGAANCRVRIYPAIGTTPAGLEQAATGTATFWNAQCEQSFWPTSPIRTSGAAATRQNDVLSIADTVWPDLTMRHGIYFKPWHSSAALIATGSETQRVYNFNGTNWTFFYRAGGGQVRIGVFAAGGGEQVVMPGATYDALADTRVEIDPAAGDMTLAAGFTSGVTTIDGAPWTYPTTGNLLIGHFYSGPQNFISGFLSEMFRA